MTVRKTILQREVINQLFSKNPKQQQQASSTILGHGQKFVPELFKCLKNKEKRAKAAMFLGALGAQDAVLPIANILRRKEVLSSEKAQLLRVLSELVGGEHAFDERITPVLREMQSDSDPLVRGFLAQVYGQLGGAQSIKYLQQMVKDGEHFVRDRAIKALEQNLKAQKTKSNTKTDIILLIEGLSNPQTAIKHKSIKLLGKLASPVAALSLFVLAASKTQEPDSQTQILALNALANCLSGAEKGLSPDLLQLAVCNCAKVRAGGLLCLGRLASKNKNILQVIMASLKDHDILVQKCAAIALAEGFKAENIKFLPELMEIYGTPKIPAYVKESLLIAMLRVENISKNQKKRLISCVKHDIDSKSTQVKKLAIVLLDRIIDNNDFKTKILLAVLKCLDDSNLEIRTVSASFLANHLPYGMQGVAGILGVLLQKEEEPECYLLIDALKRNGTKEACEVLENVSKCSSAMVRLYAKAALEELKSNN